MFLSFKKRKEKANLHSQIVLVRSNFTLENSSDPQTFL